ncbi:uncharacterized protein M421DRAFT_225639 [Didymella exigua CBS 183.55]|uniref:Uncharacterized protein n=1 Tax=Didymella exigua CBS 183.55 TaxID=1150837 RepID=A0A6A5REM9_9PLEO|nr:uncharacterized protein M421DRAFT_225639 [Didymella exigua CBS 183.55]KAF1926142.1 hypothetical protein M421DRAFT_225639 [Didymella exigua CBS 183.55]
MQLTKRGSPGQTVAAHGACRARNRFLASLFVEGEFTWAAYPIRFIPACMASMIGTLAWCWVTHGWQPRTRTPADQAVWCRSSETEDLLLVKKRLWAE